MVKADPTRNYYADLKVPATASESEIRKAFRTLALQYHPDRNPGRETDFVVKFQEIQAAHEILSDQTQRAKYDAERRKYRNHNIPLNTPNTPRTRPPPPPRNAFTTTTPNGTYYRAPPPKPAPPPQRPPPPQQHASYASGADRFTSRNFRAPPTAQKSQDARAKDADARANVFSAWQKMKQPRAAEESRGAQSKQTTSSNQGQQSNPNGTPFGRSQSTRVPSTRRGFDPGTPGGDEGQAKSAYRNYARPAPTPPSSTTPPQHPTPPSRDPQSSEVPYFEGNRMRTPYFSTAAGERTSMFEGLGRSASVRNSPTHLNRPSGTDQGSYSDSGRRQQRNSYAGRSTNPFAHMYADSSDDESESEVFQTGRKHQGPTPMPAHTQQTSPPTWTSNGFSTSQIPRRTSNGTAGNMPNSFKSRSEESINMKFSPSDWHGKFEGSGDYFAPNMQKGAAARGRTSPTRGRPTQRSATERNPQVNRSMGPPPVSPFSQPQTQFPSFPIPPPPPGPPPNSGFQPPPNVAANPTKFRPEDWANTFKGPSWAFPDQKDTSPRRGTDTAKRPSKPPRKASVTQEKRPKPPPQHDATRAKAHQASVADEIGGDADAMDIDSSTPPIPSKDSTKMGSHTAPPSPPREQPASSKANGSDVTASSTTDSKTSTSAWHGLSSMAKDDLFTSARDSSEGGIALDDLAQTLPYESQASNMHPTKTSTAQKLKFPNLPRPPQLPSKLDQIFVDLYFSQFETYVKEYRKASKQMTAHFVARDAEVDDMDHRFVHRRGETTKTIGFPSYLARMREDEEVLETWKVFQEAHLIALAQCEEIRNKTIKLYSNPSG